MQESGVDGFVFFFTLLGLRLLSRESLISINALFFFFFLFTDFNKYQNMIPCETLNT
ncbi:hypothetical protein L873DRAFT_163182 [Choiromyces venosus 120613-1]|uniref:Uncharacterized protein n=1 Tax=Choiromyces venosus 120613-1 TaxID=1336337 RepID=A0A3N4K259_9PEZI|nr:hypothetical protein L873DRAFT_163182 [Choiromyces venosus 120613-1]